MNQWFTTKELAARWGVSRQRITQMREEGLFHWKFGDNGHVLILADRVMELELYRNGKATRYPFSRLHRMDCIGPIEGFNRT